MEANPEKESSQIEELLRLIADEKEDVDEDMILEIYRLEEELSTLDRRHGIKNRIQDIIETFNKQQ